MLLDSSHGFKLLSSSGLHSFTCGGCLCRAKLTSSQYVMVAKVCSKSQGADKSGSWEPVVRKEAREQREQRGTRVTFMAEVGGWSSG